MRSRRTLIAVVVAMTAMITGLAVSPASATATPAESSGPLARFYEQTINWTDCPKAKTNLQCGTVTVPLDYRNPDGMTINIAVNRLLTAGPAAPNLLTNPGGPGGSGLELVEAAGNLIVSPRVTRTYNMVGFDPRGVGKSFPLECLTPEQMAAGSSVTPETTKQISEAAKDSALMGTACESVAKGLISNIGTDNVASDMDILRAALGDSKLNYLGISYGTYLGTMYGHLFPENVGRMVLDSVETPFGDVSDLARLQARGFQDSLRDWANGCARRPLCSTDYEHVSAAGLVRKVTAVSERLVRKPLPARKGGPVTQSDFLNMVQTALTIGEIGGGWTLLDGVLKKTEDGDGEALAGYRDYSSTSSNMLSVNLAVQCSDRPTEGSTATTLKWAKRWAKFAPTFGSAAAWAPQTCFTWPVRKHQPTLPVTPNTNAPVLLLNGLHDPNTPISGARATAHVFSHARLLTWTGSGHATVGRGDMCIDRAIADYLVNGQLPKSGAVCVSHP